MPQGSSAVRPTNGLYLYIYHRRNEFVRVFPCSINYCYHKQEIVWY